MVTAGTRKSCASEYETQHVMANAEPRQHQSKALQSNTKTNSSLKRSSSQQRSRKSNCSMRSESSQQTLRSSQRWCTRTHLLHAHFSGLHALRVHFAHSFACYTHACLKGVCSAHVVVSLSSHLFPSHVSPVVAPLLFLDGHFETTPDYDLTDFDVHDFLPNFPNLKADEEFGYLADSTHCTDGRGRFHTRVRSNVVGCSTLRRHSKDLQAHLQGATVDDATKIARVPLELTPSAVAACDEKRKRQSRLGVWIFCQERVVLHQGDPKTQLSSVGGSFVRHHERRSRSDGQI